MTASQPVDASPREDSFSNHAPSGETLQPSDDRSARPTIRQLPPNLVNQIAAGEVIERPASVVKELMENAIDAGASRVEVTIEGGGTEMIRVSDDGCGMSADQLPLAVSSHATSKLPTDETLFGVRTLGFRGEALASIGSVSHLRIRTRTADSDSGFEMEVRGGEVSPPSPSGAAVGTTMEVRQLFFNTPVRRKFLKTATTERGHIHEAFTRLALANPRVHFVLQSSSKTTFDLPATSRLSERIAAFFGSEIADNLIPIRSDDDVVRVDGYVCDPAVSRGNNRMQYLFLNGRHIRDRSLQHALGEAYRGMLMVGRFPVCFLRMHMPADLVDVNVHPCKLEVRFTDGGRVYSRLLQSLRHQFLKTDLNHRSRPSDPAMGDDELRRAADAAAGTISPAEAEHRQSVIDWARTGDTASSARSMSAGATTTPRFKPFPDRHSVVHRDPDLSSPTVTPEPTGLGGDGVDPSSPPPLESPTSSFSSSAASSPSAPWDASSATTDRPSVCRLGLQVHQRYLVTQDEDGMVVIDQHALHERILYERICTRVLAEGRSLESQNLLVPEPVSLTPAERSAALEVADVLEKVGLAIEDFGGDTLLIRSYPAMLPTTPPGDLLRGVLETLMGSGKRPDAKDLLNHLLSTMACKAAVKAGDRLSSEEITSLLEQKDLYHDTHHCPHGRPTALFFSRDELDRMFGRQGPRSIAKEFGKP